jgi:dipeptidyl aminopeptidase/acylaminoacyl peptidase
LATWAEFSAAAPDLAAEGRRQLYRRGDGEAMLATVRDGEPPRLHPINVGIVGDRLYAFLLRSAKRLDLERDGRFALHSHQDPSEPNEFLVRGRAQRVLDRAVRSDVAAGWYFTVDETYHLFEMSIQTALIGLRAPDEWPPRYTSWTAPTDPTDP